MKKKLAAGLLITFFSGLHYSCVAQKPGGKGQKSSTTLAEYSTLNSQTTIDIDANQDSVIKARLIDLAVNNPMVRKADDDIKIAQVNLSKAKSSWLSSLSATGNVNEFSLNGSSAASYYPKYNFGVVVPFDIFSRTMNDKRIALHNVDIAKLEKEDRVISIKKEVLTLYENYKEKKELLRLGKISAEGDNEAYIAAQKSYTDGTIHLDEMNRTYQTYIMTETKLVSAQRDYNVAVVDIENEIGIPIEDAISQALNQGQNK